MFNAINFTNQGNITLGYTSEGGKIIFFVSDTGTGVTKEKQEKLFDSYLNGSQDNFDPGEGSGIGLYLASRLATLLGGKLYLEYTSEVGSKFCLQIPAHKNPELLN